MSLTVLLVENLGILLWLVSFLHNTANSDIVQSHETVISLNLLSRFAGICGISKHRSMLVLVQEDSKNNKHNLMTSAFQGLPRWHYW